MEGDVAKKKKDLKRNEHRRRERKERRERQTAIREAMGELSDFLQRPGQIASVIASSEGRPC